MSNLEDILWARQQAMREEKHPEDTVFFQLTLNEVCLLTYALILTRSIDGNIKPRCDEMCEKIADIVETQKET